MSNQGGTNWQAGDVILDLYQVVERLRQDGQGEVYKVRHLAWHRDLEVLCPKLEIVTALGGAQSFLQYLEDWIQLGLHPYLVSCYYGREMAGYPLLFIESVNGTRLQDWLADPQFSANGPAATLRRILDIAIQWAWGLHYLHEQGVTHQQVQPAHAVIAADGTVKVTDVGLGAIAAALASEAALAPELARGEAATPQTDLWGWGWSILEMFAGQPLGTAGPFAVQVLEEYLKNSPAKPELPAMPSAVAQFLRQCLQYQPAQRPTSSLVLAEALQGIYQHVLGNPYPRRTPTFKLAQANQLNNQGVLLWDLGQPDEALKRWEQALESAPQHLESIYNRGLMAWRFGRGWDDRILLQQLQQCRTPVNGGKVDYLLSLVHLERGDYETAFRLLEALMAQGKPSEELQSLHQLVQARRPHARRLLRSLIEPQSMADRARAVATALSPDGRYALSGGDDKGVTLWETTTGKAVLMPERHPSRLSAVAFSPDAYQLLSGSEDGSIKLWNVPATSLVHTFDGQERLDAYQQRSLGRLMQMLLGSLLGAVGRSVRASGAGEHQGAVLALAFSSDGRYFLSGSNDKTVKLWSVSTGKCLKTLRGHTGAIFFVSFGPGRQYFLSASEDHTIKVWELSTGALSQTLNVPDLDCLALSADGRYILTGGQIQLFDMTTGQVARSFDVGAAPVHGVALTADNRYFLSAAGTELRLWELETGRCLHTFEGHSQPIQAIALSQEGHTALSTDDKALKVWSVYATATTAAPFQFAVPPVEVSAPPTSLLYEQAVAQARAALAQNNPMLAAQQLRRARSQPGCDRSLEALQIWLDLYAYLPRPSLSQVWEQATLVGQNQAVCAIALSADNRLILSGGADCTVKLWELATEQCQLSLTGHTQTVTAVAFSPTGNSLVSGSRDHTLRVWSLATGECLAALTGHAAGVTSVALSPDGRFVVSGSLDRTLKLWDLTTGYGLRSIDLEAEVATVAFSPDGQWVLAGCDRHLSQWDLVTGTYRRRLEGHTAAVTAVAVSWDGRYAVSGSGDQTLKLWDVANGERIRTLTGHQGVVHAVAFSADGRHIVSGSADHTLKLWDVTSGECLHTLTGHQAAVHAVAFSVDGRYIVSGGADQTLKLWICDWELDDRFPADWDEGARAYLEVFVSQRTPKAALLPADRPPTEAEVALAFQPQGTPAWTETDFQALLRTLQWAGYGWLRPEGIRQQLERMTAAPAKMVFKQPESTVFSTSFGTEFATSFGTGFGTAALTAKVVLAVVEGSLAGQEFEFRDRITCVIGRAKDCDLQLPNDEDHKTVSRYHCQLEIYPPTIRVRDLGSLHGTYVNDRMIGRRRLGAAGEEKDCPDVDLKDGDRIRLGKTVFQVKIVELKTEAIKGAEVDDTGLFANQQLDNDSKQDSQSNNSRSDQTPMSS